MPEGRHGIFTGGGGSVRISRVIGADRLTEIMLTGRTVDADEGVSIGLSHHIADDALEAAVKLANSVTENADMSNRMIIEGLDRISNMSAEEGLFTESLAVALTQVSGDMNTRVKKYVGGRKQSSKKPAK
jgi:enoyl-CoA hydratase/carnithine racemase